MNTTTLEPVYHPIVKRVVGRLHVSTRKLSAVRAVLKSLTGDWRKLPKHFRRYVVAAAIQHQAEDYHLYRYVVGTVPREYPEFKPRYFFNPETKETTIQP